MKLKNIFSFFIFVTIIFGVSLTPKSSLNDVSGDDSYSGLRGVNLGNFLEAPNEGDWTNGLLIKEKHFQRIASAGFNLVRVPIRWNAHAMDITPYTIDSSFFDRVDWVIDQSFANNLSIIINIHHYNELMADPESHRGRFLELWQQISHHYQNYSHDLFFEVLNEPHDNLTNILWNQYLQDAIDIIRVTNPDRTLIVGPTNWNNVWTLSDLVLPQNDSNIVATFHFYSPFEFTHQGAEWVSGSNAWLGTNWTSSQAEKDGIDNEIDFAVNWAKTNNRSLFIGEFGAYQYGYMNGRIEWTAYVRAKAESIPEMWGWAYWEFCSGFGIMDSSLSYWYTGLLGSLLPDSPLIKRDYSTSSSLPVLESTPGSESSSISFTTTSESTNLEIMPILLLTSLITVFYKKKQEKSKELDTITSKKNEKNKPNENRINLH
ncbi:MAG: glycoside hydrolase family 5 protein [Candidatus Heimdallarchaeota archaeon]|nr:MAG: glycoside hydrolase family 5 protein [Candidatus Heimdallarchaeota archaeon]